MKLYKSMVLAISLALGAGLTACDDDVVRQELSQPSVSETAGNYQSLDFEWNAVANTSQYGYKLFAPDGSVVEAGVTPKTKASFDGLQPATTYTLRVWAFAGLDTDYSTSPVAEITATTAALVKLATPANLTVTDDASGPVATWDAVENATSYNYVITDSQGTEVAGGTLTDASLKISGLEGGDYTFSVIATSDLGGFIDSDAATATFTYNVITELWRVTGDYYSAVLGQTWPATLIALSDGSYSIPAFYQADGYDLNFTVASDGCLQITNGTNYGDGYYGVSTGNASVGSIDVYVAESSYTGFDGSADSGEVWMSYYIGSEWYSSDTFTWPSQSGTSLTIDDLVGSYTNYMSGMDYLGDTDVEYTNEEWYYKALVEKVDDTTVSISNLYWEGYPANAKVDVAARTVTIEAQAAGSYQIASVSGYSDAIVGTIADDGTITLPHVAYWYYFEGDGWYYYSDFNMTLTKDGGAAKVRKAAKPAPSAKSHKSVRTVRTAKHAKVLKPALLKKPVKAHGRRATRIRR